MSIILTYLYYIANLGLQNIYIVFLKSGGYLLLLSIWVYVKYGVNVIRNTIVN